MRKKIFAFTLAAMALFSASAQDIGKGEKIVDLGIGVGDCGGAMFTQRLNFECILNTDVLSDNLLLGLGAQLSNGVRNTSYTSKWETPELKSKLTRDDISIMPTVSLHGKFVRNLDLYATFGLGLGIMNWKENVTMYETVDPNTVLVKTIKDSNSTACFSTGFYVGARYFLNESWGLNAQIGLISANVRKSWGNSYNVFSIGGSYRF